MLAERGVSWRFFERHGITRKKAGRATEQDRPDVLKRHEEWFEGQLDLDPERLDFIDETRACAAPAWPRRGCSNARRTLMPSLPASPASLCLDPVAATWS